MPNTLWNNAGAIVTDAQGRPIECDHCPCPICTRCSGATPAELLIEISGLQNAACEECPSLDGSYVVQWGEQPLLNEWCAWYFYFSHPAACDQGPPDSTWIEVLLRDQFLDVTIRSIWGILGDWRLPVTPPLVCTGWNSLDIPVAVPSTHLCDWSTSICTVTALP